MRTRNPDQRYRDTVAATVRPTHAYEQDLWNTLHGMPVVDKHVAWAAEIHEIQYEREILQAWLLARAVDEDVAQWLRIPVEVTRVYRHLFFDVSVFRDELDLLSWVQEYNGTPYGTNLLREAAQGGVEKMCWTFGRNTYVASPEHVKQQTMTAMYMRSLAGRGHAITSREAQAALAHGNAALKAAQITAQSTPVDPQAFLVKLRYRDETEAITDAVKKEDILH